jgi:hypothetical protein
MREESWWFLWARNTVTSKFFVLPAQQPVSTMKSFFPYASYPWWKVRQILAPIEDRLTGI